MAYEEQLRNITLIAGADLSAKQYHFVDEGAGGLVAVTVAGAKAVGVLQVNDADAAGKRAAVGITGVSFITLGATLARGAEVSSDADGRAKAVAATERSHGTLLEGGDAGDIVAMLLHVNSYASAT